MLEGVLPDDPSRQPLDCGTDAGRAKTFVIFAPADDAVLGGDLDEVVVSPARVAGQDFDGPYFRSLRHGFPLFFAEYAGARAPDRSRSAAWPVCLSGCGSACWVRG